MKPPLHYLLRVRLRRVWCRIVLAPRFKRFGRGAVVERPLLILGHKNISLGSNSSIRGGARIEAHQRFVHRTPRLSIGSQTNIEQYVHIMCQSRIEIGDRVSITGQCAIVDVIHPINDGVGKIGDQIVDEDTYVEIGDDVFVGFGSVILPNVRIGTGAVIGANSVVTTDVPSYAIVAGAPARVIGQRTKGTLDGK